MEQIQNKEQLEVELMKKINKILNYIGECYDKRIWPQKTFEDFKNKCDEIICDTEDWLEVRWEGKYGYMWMQIDMKQNKPSAFEYTYNPESEFFYNEEETDEFLAEHEEVVVEE